MRILQEWTPPRGKKRVAGRGSYGEVVFSPQRKHAHKTIFACERSQRFDFVREVAAFNFLQQTRALPVPDFCDQVVASEAVHALRMKAGYCDAEKLARGEKAVSPWMRLPQHTRLQATACWMFDILRTLAIAHMHLVVHRDVKSPNVILVPQSREQLGGSGRAEKRLIEQLWEGQGPSVLAVLSDWGISSLGQQFATRYKDMRVVTRGYKAPELLLQHSLYDSGIDVWAAGIIAAQLLLGYQPCYEECDKEALEHLEKTFGTCSVLVKDGACALSSSPVLHEVCLVGSEAQRWVIRHSKRQQLPDDALQFLLQALHPVPESRPDALALLQHPFLQQHAWPHRSAFMTYVPWRAPALPPASASIPDILCRARTVIACWKDGLIYKQCELTLAYALQLADLSRAASPQYSLRQLLRLGLESACFLFENEHQFEDTDDDVEEMPPLAVQLHSCGGTGAVYFPSAALYLHAFVERVWRRMRTYENSTMGEPGLSEVTRCLVGCIHALALHALAGQHAASDYDARVLAATFIRVFFPAELLSTREVCLQFCVRGADVRKARATLKQQLQQVVTVLHAEKLMVECTDALLGFRGHFIRQANNKWWQSLLLK